MPFDRGRDPHTRRHTADRYALRAGMAYTALRHKDQRPITASDGQPMPHEEMAERHSRRQLSKWAADTRPVTVTGGMDFCPTCHRVPDACTC